MPELLEEASGIGSNATAQQSSAADSGLQGTLMQDRIFSLIVGTVTAAVVIGTGCPAFDLGPRKPKANMSRFQR
jgi:hypothetical protein